MNELSFILPVAVAALMAIGVGAFVLTCHRLCSLSRRGSSRAYLGKYNEELVKAGIMLAGEGLHPSSKGVRVRFSGSERTVVNGPFSAALTPELRAQEDRLRNETERKKKY